MKKVSKVGEECCPLKGGFLEGPMQSLKCDSGSDGTAHHGAQHGKQTNQTVRIPPELIHRGPTVHHPSNGSPRTANTWEYIAVHEKQEANRAATASHGELPRLPSREGRKKMKLKKEEKNSKGEQTLGYLGVVNPVTPKEDVPLRGVTHVQRIKIGQNGQLIDTKHLILTFHSPKIPESVRAGYIKLTVRPYIPNPFRCFKCQRFGHSKVSCRGTLTCSRCAEAGHDSSDCKASEKCVNYKGSHTSFSRLCSAWKFEKEVIVEKVEKDISFLEARQIVKSRTPAPGTSYASAVRKKPETASTRILPTILPSVPSQASYTSSEICPRFIDSVLKLSLTDTRNETVSFQFKVPESNKNPPDFSDFKTVTNRKKLKKDSQVNQDNITVDKVCQYYKPPQLTYKEPSEASNSVIKEKKAKVLQSLESDADAEMSSSSASEGDTLEYDMSEDLEDTPQNVYPTTPPPPSTARKR
ncbi:hypothetical protein AVEN_111088-1 [Araneus ventricosus]|uniref:CCHC-type domain-containing protein n=1 Tax=Araneus ventricosus TaxID=182803 RepID=A0A4Y2DQ64_ARAVE|nr:hypothetical protein AVEN_111088-1 [Araneus ventricosus]